MTFKPPPELGRWQTIYIDQDEEEKELKLEDCRNVIEPEIMKTSEPELFRSYKQGNTFCLDPDTSVIERFTDGQNSSSRQTKVDFLFCEVEKFHDPTALTGVQCFNGTETEAWRESLLIVTTFFTATTSIDFSATAGYFADTVKVVKRSLDLEPGMY